MTKAIFIMFVILLTVFLGYYFFGFSVSTVQEFQPISDDQNTVVTTSLPLNTSASSSVTTSSDGAITTSKICKITGCSSQVCAQEDVTTDCMYREEYMCYQKAKCEVQPNGKCGWTLTSEIQACLTQYE